jgi:hypothetical protein
MPVPDLKPSLVACYFDGMDGATIWPRLARVLAYTASQHCPGWDVQIQATTPAPLKSALGIISHVHNTQKMEHWYEAVQRAPDGARLLLIDADTMILRSLDDVWTGEFFDYAYTTKKSKYPFNSGVVFLRVSDRTRAFMKTWRDENVRMLGDRVHHQVWRRKYGGINQAALGFALESSLTAGLTVRQLPCLEWNCEDNSWPSFDPAVTRIVHLKSALRRAALSIGPNLPVHRPLVTRWRRLEREATAANEPAVEAPAINPSTGATLDVSGLTQRLNLCLTVEEYDALCRLAIQRDVPVTRLGRMAIRRYLGAPTPLPR